MRIAIPQSQGAVAEAYAASGSISLHKLDFNAMESRDEGLLEFASGESSVGWLAERDVDAVLVGSIEPEIAQSLADRGIHVFTGADDLSPSENVSRFLKLMREALERSQGGGCCGGGGHGHHHGHEGHGGGCCGGGGHGHHHHDQDEGGCCGGHGHQKEDHECCGGTGENCCRDEEKEPAGHHAGHGCGCH